MRLMTPPLDEAGQLDGEARLLRGFAGGGLLDRLADLDEAAGEGPLALEGFAAAADQDDPSLGGDYHVRHELRRLRSGQGPTSSVVCVVV